MTDHAKVTLRNFSRWYREGRKIVALTAYDAMLARMVDRAGADLILVGDSLGMVLLGYPTTIHRW